MDGQGAETELREHSQNNITRQKKAENEKVSSHEVLEKLSKMNKEDMKGGAAKMGFDQLMKYQRDCNSHSNWALRPAPQCLIPRNITVTAQLLPESSFCTKLACRALSRPPETPPAPCPTHGCGYCSPQDSPVSPLPRALSPKTILAQTRRMPGQQLAHVPSKRKDERDLSTGQGTKQER